MRCADQLGRAIREWRSLRGRDIADLAAESGICPQRLARIERGEERCASVELFAVATALDIAAGAILAGSAPRGLGDLDDPHVRAGIALIEQMISAERLVVRYGL